MRVSRCKERGAALVAMCGSMFLLLAVTGMVFDLGRIYIAHNEAQIFTDAASMAAAKALDGTDAGLDRARAAVKALPDYWNLGTQSFANVQVSFSADGSHWKPAPENVPAVQFARVEAPANHVEITLLRVVGAPSEFTVPAFAASVKEGDRVRLVQ